MLIPSRVPVFDDEVDFSRTGHATVQKFFSNEKEKR